MLNIRTMGGKANPPGFRGATIGWGDEREGRGAFLLRRVRFTRGLREGRSEALLAGAPWTDRMHSLCRIRPALSKEFLQKVPGPIRLYTGEEVDLVVKTTVAGNRVQGGGRAGLFVKGAEDEAL